MKVRILEILSGERGNSLTSLLALSLFVGMYALPGLMLSVGSGTDPAGVTTGLSCFVLIYWCLLQWDDAVQFFKARRMRHALRAGYWTLFALLAAVPIGMVMNMMIGLLSIGIVTGMTLADKSADNGLGGVSCDAGARDDPPPGSVRLDQPDLSIRCRRRSASAAGPRLLSLWIRSAFQPDAMPGVRRAGSVCVETEMKSGESAKAV